MIDAPLLLFAASTALLLAMPGPTNALLAAAGAARGLTGAATLVLAELAGYAIALSLFLALDGMAGSLRGEAGLALRSAAAILLIATAWRMWRSAGASDGIPGAGKAPGAGHVFLLTLFNPKTLILAFAVFPPAVQQGALPLAAGLFAAVAVATGFGWILVGAATRALPGRPDIVVARLSSLVIAGFACYFVAAAVTELMPPAA